MAGYLTHGLILDLIGFQVLILLVILSNIRLLHRARRHAPPVFFPMVSILVPARNEEKNISGCIQSLLAQDYPFFEILALDDQSSDATRSVLQQIANTHPKLKVLVGSPPPEGWLGKNWACSQMARHAQGDLLFFTDADTFHQPGALRAIVTAMMGEQADLLTGFPRQEVYSWGEKLLVPFFSWALICFNPLELAYRTRSPVLSNAIGQMMLFRREAYQAINGHDSLASSIIEDLALARRIKAARMRWRTMNLTDLITCRMYHGSKEAFEGFSKNFFAAFDFHLLAFLFSFLWLAVTFCEPWIVLILWIFGRASQARLEELIACIALSLLFWLIPYRELRIPSSLAFLYPITMLATEVVAFQSLRLKS